jgi:hypothetical protein
MREVVERGGSLDAPLVILPSNISIQGLRGPRKGYPGPDEEAPFRWAGRVTRSLLQQSR